MMTIKKSFNLLPTILIVASSLTIVACSKQESTPQPEQKAETPAPLSQMQEMTPDAQTKVEEAAQSATSAAEEAVQSAGTTMEKAETAAMESAGAPNAEMMELAKKSGCMVCHAIDKKVIGPSWHDVAAKYHGQADAKTTLINSISKGSTGKWGTVAMPPNSPKVSDADIAKLAEFVLTIK